MKTWVALLKLELRQAWGGDLWLSLGLFVMGSALPAFALQDAPHLPLIGGVIILLLLGFQAMLHVDTVFADPQAWGLADMMRSRGVGGMSYSLMRMGVYFIVYLLPVLILMPLVLVFYGWAPALSSVGIGAMAAVCLMCQGSLAGALVGAGCGGLLAGLIIFPLYSPVFILALSSLQALVIGGDLAASLRLLLACVLLNIAVVPWAVARAISVQEE